MNYFSLVEQDEIDLERYSNKGSWWWIGSMLKTMKEGVKKWKQDTYMLRKY
jgi:hypothetical protein